MYKKIFVINDHSKCEQTYKESIEYLETQPALEEKVATHIWTYRETADLVPQTTTNFGSGHFFPYAESVYEVESSCELALQGFYRQALAGLRSVLELGLLSVYFDVNDTAHIDVQNWLASLEQTPRRKKIFDRLCGLDTFRQFDRRFNLLQRIQDSFGMLDRYVHTRGYEHSGSALNRANFNRFSETSLKHYCDSLGVVVRDVIVVMLLKYPIGLQPLPLTSKFGLNGPVGGLLENHQVELMRCILEPSEKQYLQELSDQNEAVQRTVRHIEQLPDLSEEQWTQQAAEWEEQKKALLFKN